MPILSLTQINHCSAPVPGEQLAHVLHQVLVQAQAHDLLLELAQPLLALQHLLEPLLQRVVLDDQLPDVTLFLVQLGLQSLDVLNFVCQLGLVVVLHGHLVFVHEDFELGALVLNGGRGLQLHCL